MPKAFFTTGRVVRAFCYSVIAAISSVDIWFAVANSEISTVEKNPICMALINLDPSGFSFFIVGKALGTVCVLASLMWMFRTRYRHAKTVLVAITLFQLGLLMYLTLSDPLTYNLPNFSLLFSDAPESIWHITDVNGRY
ncbi:hypothetical protein [Mariniblastus fucicola]|uniref:DUF5658 domain-containing protein n=1 Tax=Mariniblastus fucicola TaxID=980251 RepID=A0A5B9PAR1_9BACT|nr:hypothetical protein [Mariniblastus fucicola]QEG20191.1 hypothetical protein MFFC18_00380 [Mariniblastus fucicola]